MDEFSKYIYSLATLLKQHLKVKSFFEKSCIVYRKCGKRDLKTQNIIGEKRHKSESRAASGFQQMGLDPIGMKPRDMSFLRLSCYFIFVCEFMNALVKIKLVRKLWFFSLLLTRFSPSQED